MAGESKRESKKDYLSEMDGKEEGRIPQVWRLGISTISGEGRGESVDLTQRWEG